MSTRSILEFNHDFAHEIREDPEGFIECLGRYLGSASKRNAELLQLKYGVTVAWSGHHSNQRKVVTEFSETEL